MSMRQEKEDKFSFGLWTVGNRGRDPFGDFVRPALDPVKSVSDFRTGSMGNKPA